MFDKVLSMLPVLDIPGFWIAQDSEQVSSSECARVLDIPVFWTCVWFWICQKISNKAEFWICQGYTGFKTCLDISWLCLNISDYVCTDLNMPEHFGMCVNISKSSWIGFVLHFPCSYITLHVVTYLKVYKRLEVIIAWRKRRLFSWRGKIWFFL